MAGKNTRLLGWGKGRKKIWEWGNFQAGYEMILGGKAVERICSIVRGLFCQMPKSAFGSNFLFPLVMMGFGVAGDSFIFILLIFNDLST